MAQIVPLDAVHGVKTAHLRVFGDSRGRFLETFRKEWFPERSWDIVQANRSDSAAGVLRGLHYHFHQVDYWTVLRGRIRVGLYDLRRSSPTHGAGAVLEMSEDDPAGLFIPVGVAHGFLGITDCSLAYLVDNYYDDTDEHGVAWNDPDIGLDWGIAEPVLSDRDRANRPLRGISPDELPA